MNLKDAPIQQKLTTIILVTTGVALLFACAGFMAYEVFTFRTTLLNEVRTTAAVIAANSTGALAFRDEKTATEFLSTLKADRNILHGAIYDAEGKLFAKYPAHEPDASFSRTPPPIGHRFDKSQLILFAAITKDENQLGTIYLKSDLGPLTERIQLYSMIVLLVMGASFFVAFALSRWLQKSVTRPIIELSETARAVSDQRNYLVRADKYGNDELGKLTEAFNHMLAQIHERDLALLANQERLKLALSASQTGTWDWDLKTNRVVWDDFTQLLFGLKPGTFSGTYEGFINLVHPQDRVSVLEAVEETLKSNRELNMEFQVIWPDGSAHQIASRGKAIYDETRKPIRMSGVCLDITERKRQEEEIRTLNMELEQRVLLRTAELTASIREMETFTYSVSHDLRAPLRHIVAFAEILQEEFSPQLDPAAQDYINRIMHGARNMSQLVDDLLNLARIGRQGLNKQRVNLTALVQETLVELHPEIENRKIEWKIGPLLETEGDPGLLRQVFANLLSNAVKYTRPRPVAVIEIGKAEKDGETAIYIRDNGVGFNMKFADKLFGVFQRLHRAEEFEGTGVGLATVERIIHKHGGRVWAESEPEKGSTFFFTIDVTKMEQKTDTGFLINLRRKR